MSKINSRQKGARGEREWVQFLRDKGFDAYRSQQFCGKAGDADVVCGSLPFHFEVKRVETFSVYKALEQARRDCAKGKMPVVAHKRNRKQWIVVIEANDFFNYILK